MWTCSECGEQVENNFDICWKCESPRDGAVEEEKSTPNEMSASSHRRICPDCNDQLQPIKIIDATCGPGWDHEGTKHIELSYAAPDARRSLFFGKIPRLGIVKGMICPKCGRILFYGEKT